jgi:hypothetical protein
MNDSITLSLLEAKAQDAFTILDDYRTFLSCLDKPDLVQMTRDVLCTRKYTSRTPNRLMIGHLLTVKRRELGYEDLLDAIDALKEGAHA